MLANSRSSSSQDRFNRSLWFRSYDSYFSYFLPLIYFVVHYYLNARNGDFAVSHPLVLGHEAGGIVTAVGHGVNNFKIGDRVAIEAGIYCRNCNFCDKGRYNLCKEMKFCSSASVYPHVDGTLQTKMNHPAHVLHQYVSIFSLLSVMEPESMPFSLPDSCSFDQASLAEPLSVVIHASRRCGLAPSQTVLVYGVGAIGLLACALAKHSGASRVCAIDINPVRLEFAMKHGFADAVYCLPSPSVTSAKSNGVSINGISKCPAIVHPAFSDDQIKRSKDAATAALAAFDSKDGFDVVFECTGAESPIQMCIFVSILRSIILSSVPSTIHSPKRTYLQQTATTGGRVMLIGMGTRVAQLPLSTAALREVDILGSFRYADTYPEALSLLSSPSSKLRTMVSKLVTHRFELSDTKKAFEMLAKGVDENGQLVLKIMVGPGVQ